MYKNNFDLLRLIFASMVVFFHMGILSQNPNLYWMTQYISSLFAVQAFFVVSGYLVTMSYEKSRSMKEYWRKRISRLAPAYIFVVVFAAVILSIISEYSFSEYFSHKDFWRYIFYNLIFANFSAPSLPGVFLHQFESAINVSLWTIKIEVLFYACVPLIVFGCRRWGYQRTLVTIFLLSLAWREFFYLRGMATDAEFYFKMAKQLPGQMVFFCGGAWCYYKTRDGFQLSWKWAAAGIISYIFATGWFFELIAPIGVTLFVTWAALSLPHVLNVGKHGDFSFGIYLYHAPIVQSLIFFGLFAFHPFIAIVIGVFLVLMMAIISWNFIEKPFLRHRKVKPINNNSLSKKKNVSVAN
ncbi:peptidoglycan/LPS O-acetylase OafA/YrhL [Janthinobacterium lividum]|uniref:acyltransferase family protein n=1 Tax=Janthinobacterium lividum TaxID=29581 RepID=UPI003D1FABA3